MCVLNAVLSLISCLSICVFWLPEKTCPRGGSLPLGHGVNTGRCVNAETYGDEGNNSTSLACEILAWCPVERDVRPLGPERALLEAAENFTVLIKNQVFLKFS